MAASSYQIVKNVSSDDKVWGQFREIVESEGWKSDDHSVMELTPILSSTRSVIAKDNEGNFIGCVVWNEYDEVAFIGFYLLCKEYRGKGIGSILWKKAISMIPTGYTIGLRSVPYMASRYQSMDTPIEGPKLNEFNTEWRQILEICRKYENLGKKTIKSIRNLNNEDFNRFLEYDQRVTGKDRSDFLKKFYKNLPFTAGNILLDENNDIIATAGITSTSTKESHMFKLAPIYANSLEDAFTVTTNLIQYAGQKDDKAIILFHLISDTKGEKELLPVLTSLNVTTRLTGVTLYSKEIIVPINTNLVYVAHNNSGHYDM